MAKKVTAILVLSVFVLLLVVGMAWARKFAPLPPPLNYAPEDNYVSNYLLKPVGENIFTGTTASPGTVVGNTYYDYQHNGSIPHMIARDYQAAPGGKHFTWMESADIDVVNSNRYCVYNYLSPAGGWKGATRITAGPARAGYTGVEVMKDSREVVIFHYAAITGVEARPRRSLLAIEDTTSGYGEFRYYDIPDSGVTVGAEFVEGGMWPHGDIDTLNRIHVVMQEGVTAAGRSWWGYTRCREIGTGTNIKLVCETYNPNPPNSAPPCTLTKGAFTPNAKNGVATVARTGVISEIVACSRVSQKVAMIWAWPTLDTTQYQVGNDIYYIESTNGGDDWIANGFGVGNPPPDTMNITKFKADDTYKAYADIAAIYDYNDKLHIFANLHKLNTETQESDFYDVALMHWSKDTERECPPGSGDSIRYSVVAAGKWSVSNGSPGGWNRNMCKMNAGVGVPGGSNYNYLYLSWTQFNANDKALNGYINGEIYTAMSTNAGLTWGKAKNVTNSNTNGCTPNNCDSDHWGSIAAKVDSFIYHQYVNDKDPGGFVQNEGSGTLNPILYYAQPVTDLVAPAAPRVDWTPKSLAIPWISVPNGGDTTVQFTVSNIGTATLNVTSISETVSWMSLGTTNAIITEGGCPVEVNVYINCGAYSDTFLYDSIYVASNDTNVYVPVGVVVSNTYKKAKFVNVTNGNFWMTQANLGNIGHQRWGFCLDTLGTSGNTGTLVNPLYDGSIILGQQASAPRVGRYIFNEQNMLALDTFKVVSLTVNPTNLNAYVVKKRFAPMNPVPPEWGNWWCWGVEEYDVIFKPGTSPYSLERWLMVQYVKVFKSDVPDWWSSSYPCPAIVPDLYVGEAIDFDVKSDSGSDNYPGFDAALNLLYQQGYGGGNKPNQYAGVALHDPYKKPVDQPAAYGGHVIRNDVYVYPMSGYRDDSLYSVMTQPGFAILDTSTSGKPEDFDCVLTAGKILSHTPNLDITQYRLVVAFSNKGLDTLKYMVNMVRCGNASRGVDGANPDNEDVLKMANMILKQQEQTWLYMSDVNGDCAVNLADVIYLANNVQKGNTKWPLKCNCEVTFCQISPSPLPFGQVSVGSYMDQTFTITNAAAPGGATLSGTITENSPDYSLVGNTTYSLTPGQSQIFTVRFTPTSTGDKPCTLETGCTECGWLPCSGTGKLP